MKYWNQEQMIRTLDKKPNQEHPRAKTEEMIETLWNEIKLLNHTSMKSQWRYILLDKITTTTKTHKNMIVAIL